MAYDLLLRGGNVIDGSGAAGFVADVAIADGRIAEIGQVPAGSAARVLDVSGAAVCPGFIDLHSHTDYTIFSAPSAITQATQGVTTLVTGNCGFSPFPVVPAHASELRSHGGFLADGLSWEWESTADYADAVDALPLGVNLALQVGHDALRIGAMGLAERAPLGEELGVMRSLLAAAAADGAVGFSTGLIYAPGLYASLDELVALASEAAAAGLLYSTHMRNEGEALLEAIDEALTTARLSGVRLEISHLKAAGSRNWGLVADALEAISAARAEGVDVAADQYPYTASSTTLTAWLPGWALDGGTPELLRRLASPKESARIAGQLSGLSRELRAEAIVLADTPEGPYRRFVGKSIAEVAVELGLSPAETILEVLRGQRGSVGIVNHTMSEDDVRHVMRDPMVSVASDSHTPGCPGRGRPHPRGLGTFTRVLGHYARDEDVLSLPLAVHKMSGLPASRLGWSDRGVVRPGAVADLAILDPATVVDNATYDDPWQLSTGLLHTLIAGEPVLESGQPTGAAPGAVLRKPA